jgi:hypothetical protein
MLGFLALPLLARWRIGGQAPWNPKSGLSTLIVREGAVERCFGRVAFFEAEVRMKRPIIAANLRRDPGLAASAIVGNSCPARTVE